MIQQIWCCWGKGMIGKRVRIEQYAPGKIRYWRVVRLGSVLQACREYRGNKLSPQTVYYRFATLAPEGDHDA